MQPTPKERGACLELLKRREQEAEPWLVLVRNPGPRLDLLPELSRMGRHWEREEALSSATD